MIFVVFVFLSEPPRPCPPRQRLPSRPHWWLCASAALSAAGEGPRQFLRENGLPTRSGTEQWTAGPVDGGRSRKKRTRTEQRGHLHVDAAKARPSPVHTPEKQSQVSGSDVVFKIQEIKSAVISHLSVT